MTQIEHDLKPLALVKAFFFANPNHSAGVRPIAALAQGHLVHDGRTIDQPTNSAHVCPREGGIIEDGAVFRLARVQRVEHFIPADAQRLGSGVQIQPVSGLVLNFCQQNGLALEAGCTRDPIALGLHADDFAVCMLTDLTDEGLAVSIRHPVFGFNFLVRSDVIFKPLIQVHFLCHAWGFVTKITTMDSIGFLAELSCSFAGMNGLHELKIADVRRETAGCVSVAFDIPENLKTDFAFEAGQYLTLEADINGASVRRSYSLCSAPSDGEWRVAIKQVDKGTFSTWANQQLASGDTIRSMAPTGRFILETDPAQSRNLIAFAAGSGITPILSQIKEVLLKEPSSVFTLFYVNRDTPSIIFREALQELKDAYLERFRLFHILTREPQDIELFNGRLDEDRCASILASDWVDVESLDAAFLCGPEEMIWACKAALEGAGMASDCVKFELFTSSAGAKQSKTETEAPVESSTKQLSIVMDGMTTVVEVAEGKSVLDAALDAGLDAPYSCMGGVCCTCRAKMISGTTEMDVNYALEPDEVEAGFVLTCQTKLKGSGPFQVDYDQQ